jgi:ATPase subunit of ABC transporter with duplicated ATPase domains
VVLGGIDLQVGPRTRLGVVGPNGVGKSTLLRILAGLDPPDYGRVTRRPADLLVGYLPQETRGAPGETVLAALARRTGVAEAEADLHAAADALAAAEPTTDAADAYDAALARYLALGGPDFEARTEEVASDLGLPHDRLHAEVAHLSGGQRARVGLAAILLARFDVFLLDEPTNDLDFAGLDRLEQFVAGLAGGVVQVSHDRAFLDRTVARVLEIDEHSHRATEYGGGWQGYLDERANALRLQQEAHERYLGERERLTERTRRQRTWSQVGVKKEQRQPRDNDKAQRDFRINATERLASKVRASERALDRLEEVDKPWEGWDLRLAITPAGRSGQVVARLSEAVVERGGFRLGPVDLEVNWGDRLAVTGLNGAGKTTLLRALLGDLPLSAGEQYLGPSVVVGELDQTRGHFLGHQRLLDAFCAASGQNPGEARTLLAKFGLGAEEVLRASATLSPGERTRAVLALVVANQVNCLVLDEPTNHLDLPAIEQLEQALDDYPGTVLLVSHDRAFLDRISLSRQVEVRNGGIDHSPTGHFPA